MPIIYYHNVIDEAPDKFDARSDRVTVDEFRSQLKYLAHRFRPVSLDDYMQGVRQGKADPEVFAITFDDGCYGVYAHADAVLQEMQIPATVFVVTDHPDAREFTILRSDELEIAFRLTTQRYFVVKALNNAMFPLATAEDRIYMMKAVKKKLKLMNEDRRRLAHYAVLKQLKVTPEQCVEYARDKEKYRTMSWDEIRELHRRGWGIGSHTRTHRSIGQLDLPSIQEELKGSLSAVRREVGIEQVAFAFPNGKLPHIGKLGAAEVRKTGYTCGLSTILPGDMRPEWDHLFMTPRVEFVDIGLYESAVNRQL